MSQADFDKVVTQELYYHKQDHDDPDNGAYLALLLTLAGLIDQGKTVKQLKRVIKSSSIGTSAYLPFLDAIDSQGKHIAGSGYAVPSYLVLTAGLTIVEHIDRRTRNIKDRAAAMMVKMIQLKKQGRSSAELIRDETKRMRNSIDMFLDTNLKAAREYAYQEADIKIDKEDGIKGWLSLAVLDNRTSAICIGYNNRFYTKKKYGSRANVPSQPPRHSNCRSILYTIRGGEITDVYKNIGFNMFLYDNESIGRDLMGDRKYKLWKDSGSDIIDFVDINKKRFYTNEELAKRLKIGD